MSASRMFRNRKVWKAIRAETRDAAAGRCATCAFTANKGMICHEEWSYDDDASTATLVGFAWMCRDCDHAHHIGRASVVGLADLALERAATVNGMTEDEVSAAVWQARHEWGRRSSHGWTTRVARELLQRHPELADLDGLACDVGEGRARVGV